MVLMLGRCAGGPRDVLDGSGHTVSDAGTPRAGYSYAARRPLVALGVAAITGVTDDESHRVLDRVAEQASACFRSVSKLSSGAARITLPIDEGGVTGAPQLTFSPPESAVQGMLCVLAPLRVSTFAPGAAGRSITVEAAWGSDLSP